VLLTFVYSSHKRAVLKVNCWLWLRFSSDLGLHFVHFWHFLPALLAFTVSRLVSSLLSQEIRWEERLWNDPFCDERDVQQSILSHTCTQATSALADLHVNVPLHVRVVIYTVVCDGTRWHSTTYRHMFHAVVLISGADPGFWKGIRFRKSPSPPSYSHIWSALVMARDGTVRDRPTGTFSCGCSYFANYMQNHNNTSPLSDVLRKIVHSRRQRNATENFILQQIHWQITDWCH